MTTRHEVDTAAEALEKARAALDELLHIKSVLKDKLPAAREALARAEKRLQVLTKPSKAASRKHELETLTARLAQAKGEPSHVEP